MAKYQYGDIECSAVPDKNGKFRAHVRVAGNRLQPHQAHDYAYDSAELFDDKNLALRHAMDHANSKFPPE